MTEADLTDKVIRQFLLGDLDDGERQCVEVVFISQPKSSDIILMTEDDLIEDYLEDRLSPVEVKKFLAYYLFAPQQRQKLRMAKSLREYVVAESGVKVPHSVEDL